MKTAEQCMRMNRDLRGETEKEREGGGRERERARGRKVVLSERSEESGGKLHYFGHSVTLLLCFLFFHDMQDTHTHRHKLHTRRHTPHTLSHTHTHTYIHSGDPVAPVHLCLSEWLV